MGRDLGFLQIQEAAASNGSRSATSICFVVRNANASSPCPFVERYFHGREANAPGAVDTNQQAVTLAKQANDEGGTSSA